MVATIRHLLSCPLLQTRVASLGGRPPSETSHDEDKVGPSVVPVRK